MSIRDMLESIHAAGVAGAQPGPATRSAVSRLTLASAERPRILALGKAAHLMAAAAVEALAARGLEPAGGVVVGPEPAPSPHPTIAVHVGDHPVPGPRSRAAAEALAAAARTPGGDAIVLLSGGTSSLVGAPLAGAGITPADVAHLTAALLGAGVDIGLLNAARKRVSRWGAGRLALALAPAAVHCLVVSDVIGDDLASIGSGPCVPDDLTAAELADRLRAAGAWDRLPPAVARHIVDPASPETPGADHPAFRHTSAAVLLGNRHAREAAADHARALGVGRVVVHAEPLLGEASACGARVAGLLVARAAAGARGECHVWGGEPTVTLDHAAADALGGRMQELALAAAGALHAAGPAAERVALLAAGTDGRDGPTDAAGAHADAATWARILAASRDPTADLRAHRSYAALHACGALLRTGLTGTNVADVVIGLVSP